jgi:tetratricopeptide (TPR) repeat protein
MAFFKKLFGYDPITARRHYDMALAYEEKPDHDKAIAELTEAIRLDPRSADTYYARAMIYEIKGDFELSLRDLNMIVKLEINPESLIAIDARFGASAEARRLVRTEELPEQVFIMPDMARVTAELAKVQLNQGQYDTAIAAFSEAIDLDTQWSFFYGRGRAYYN